MRNYSDMTDDDYPDLGVLGSFLGVAYAVLLLFGFDQLVEFWSGVLGESAHLPVMVLSTSGSLAVPVGIIMFFQWVPRLMMVG